MNTTEHVVWKSDAEPSHRGISVLGSPVGCDSFVQQHGRDVALKELPLLAGIAALDSAQAAWLLLYYCAVPRANHLLRTTPPAQIRSYAEEHDRMVLQSLATLLSGEGAGLPEEDQLWVRQARLPLRFGGCGLRNSVRTSAAAYWASLADTLKPLSDRFPNLAASLCHSLENPLGAPSNLQAAVAAGHILDSAGMSHRPPWRSLLRGQRFEQSDGGTPELGEWRHGWQFAGSSALEQHEHQNLLGALRGRSSDGPDPGPARLRSCCGRHGATWMTAAPTSQQLRLSSFDMVSALRLRLGLPINPESSDSMGYRRLADHRSQRLHARHRGLVAAWRQVFMEAGGHVPRRNVERLLRNTHVPGLPPGDMRRLDLVVPGLNVARGLPLFCDVTCVTVITARGRARPGCLTVDGGALRTAERLNNNTYPEIAASGLGRLCCLGVEVFGRWSSDPVDLIPKLARERARGLPERVRVGTRLALQHRWWSLLGTALQRAVVQAATRDVGEDLTDELLEPIPQLADLPVLSF